MVGRLKTSLFENPGKKKCLTLPVTVVTLKNWVNAHALYLQKTLGRKNLWDDEFRNTSHMFLSRCKGSGKCSLSLSGNESSIVGMGRSCVLGTISASLRWMLTWRDSMNKTAWCGNNLKFWFNSSQQKFQNKSILLWAFYLVTLRNLSKHLDCQTCPPIQGVINLVL